MHHQHTENLGLDPDFAFCRIRHIIDDKAKPWAVAMGDFSLICFQSGQGRTSLLTAMTLVHYIQ